MTTLQLSRLIKRMRDVLRADPGIDGDAQRLAQISWVLFFRAASEGKTSWSKLLPRWGSIRDKFTFDRTGIVEFANTQLIPELQAKTSKSELGTISQLFVNYATSDEVLGELFDIVDGLPLHASDRHLIGDVYERILASLQNAGTAGEFYTPRALTKLMVAIADPRPGQSIVDPASGTGGFLVSALEHTQMSRPNGRLKISAFDKKAIPTLLCATNLILHDYDDLASIDQRNVLAAFKGDKSDANQFDVLITNPPFGGEEEQGATLSFPSGMRNKETSLLFLQYAIHSLKKNGRAAFVLPDGFFFADGVASRVRQKLLSECNLHTIIRLPPGVFAPYTGIRSNVIFFTKGEPTKGIWVYHHSPANGKKSYSKTNPITFDELRHLIDWCSKGADRPVIENSAYHPVTEIEKSKWSLDLRPAPSATSSLRKISRNFEQVDVQRRKNLTSLLKRIQEWFPAGENVTAVIDLAPALSATSNGVEAIERAILSLAMSGLMRKSSVSHAAMKLRKESSLHALRPNECPAEWTKRQLGELGRVVSGATPRTDVPENFDENGIAWLTPSDLRGNRSKFVREGARRISAAGYASCSTELLPKGAVLFSSRAPIGYVAIAAGELCTNQGFKSIILDDPTLSEFLFHFLRFAAPEIDRNAPGTTFKEISAARFRAIDVWLPSMEERQHIVERLNWVHECINELIQASTATRELLQSAIEAI